MICHVCLTTDICMPIRPLLIALHDAAPTPPSPVPPEGSYLPHAEPPLPMLWPPGMLLNQNKFSFTVLHGRRCITLDGHDCGYFIPHLPLPCAPFNLKLIFIIPFSSRKTVFAASTVKMDGTAVAATQLWPPLPMMTCMNPISLPTTFPVLNLLNNVVVGLKPGDIWAGIASIAISILVDVFCKAIADEWKSLKEVGAGMNSAADAMRNVAGKTSLRQYLQAAGKTLKSGTGRDLIQQLLLNATGKTWTKAGAQWGVKALGGAVTGLARLALTPTHEGSANLAVGQPFLGVQGGGGRGADGVWNGQGQVAYLNHQSAKQKNSDGSSQTTEVVGGPLGQRQTVVQTDKTGKRGESQPSDNNVWGPKL